MADFLENTPSDFVKNILPLYQGPFVKIKVKPNDGEYTVSMSLICKESSYFAAMFKGEFTEGQTQTADMKEMSGVVSSQRIASLIQWLYHRRVQFNSTNPGEQLTAAIELARLADMCDMKRLEVDVGKCIRKIVTATPKPNSMSCQDDMNAYWVTEKHIDSAGFLPQGHVVRRTLAAASVEGFFKKKDYKFARMAREHPTFGADLLDQVKLTLFSLKLVRGPNLYATVTDHITGQAVYLNATR